LFDDTLPKLEAVVDAGSPCYDD